MARTEATPGRRPIPAIDRIAARSHREDRGHTSPCLIFDGHTDRHGYGKITVGSLCDGTRNKGALVHVVVWEYHNGPVPEGLELDHLCCQQGCHELTHLEAVTHRENCLRAWRSRMARAS